MDDRTYLIYETADEKYPEKDLRPYDLAISKHMLAYPG